MHIYKGYGTRAQATPQTEPIPGTNQQLNSSGIGYSFVLDDMMRLARFLVLGSSSNTYYATARTLTKENLEVVERLLKAGRDKEVVDKIVEISDAGRGVSNDPALFALARCCACDAYNDVTYMGKDGKQHVRVHPENIAMRHYAYAALPKVARMGTHLLHFLEFVKQFRGDGPAHLRAIRSWFDGKSVEQVAYQVLKYQQRDGWTQRDVLRVSHPHAADARNDLYHWIVTGDIRSELLENDPLALIVAYERAKKAPSDKEVAALISQYHLPREAMPTEHLKSIAVWEALLPDMPLEAMIRNLATMTKNGVLVPMGSFTHAVATRLRDHEAFKKARLHPIKVLAALITYQSGHGARSKSTWEPIAEIVDALNDAFYLAFDTVVPSGKRMVLALDVSGSMSSGTIASVLGLTPCVGAAAMALVTASVEPNYTIVAFSHQMVPVTLSPSQRLDDVVRITSTIPMGATDCALPMLWAMEKGIEADAFVVLTDSESWYGNVHPSQALQMYRQKFGIPAKLIVVGMTATQFTIADPEDGGCMNVVGFDTATPELISSFIRGNF